MALKTDTQKLFVVFGSAAVDRRLEGMVKAQLQGKFFTIQQKDGRVILEWRDRR
jgi:hypothetical protein